MKRFLVFFYILAIFMLANDAFFTWLGGLIQMTFWRQLLWLIAVIFLINIIHKYPVQLASIKRISKKYLVFFSVIVVLSVITVLVMDFNIGRILYSWWIYLSGVPFIVFPFVLRWCNWSRKKIDWLFIILGIFLSVGIFVDFLSGGLITSLFKMAVSQQDVSFESGRYCFLSTAPTIFSIYYCLCLFCCMEQFCVENNVIIKYMLLILAVVFIFASVFCGSRQTLAALLILFIFGFLNSFNGKKATGVIVVILGLITLIFLLPTMRQYLHQNEGYETRYTASSIMEDERDDSWRRGLDECIFYPSLKRLLIGEGIGYTVGQQAGNELVGYHYENTFFARISDMGWILAFWSLLFPCFYIWKKRRLCKGSIILYTGFIISYIFICCVSPNGASPTTQMALFIILGLFIDNTMYGTNYKKV